MNQKIKFFHNNKWPKNQDRNMNKKINERKEHNNLVQLKMKFQFLIK